MMLLSLPSLLLPLVSSLVSWVNPLIGTAQAETLTAGAFGKGSEEHGQTIPAVLVPHGMNFWTPQTVGTTERKCVAPYYYADTLFQGFRASHWLNGGCTQDYGSFTVMPQWGELLPDRGSSFSHADEQATPYVYSVQLPSDPLKAEMTGTSRAGIFRFVYEQPGKGYLLVRPNSDEAQGEVSIDTLTSRIIARNPVHRIYQGKGQEAGFSGWLVLEAERQPVAYGTFDNEGVYPGELSRGGKPGVGAYLEFDLEMPRDTLMARCATSFVDMEGALSNLSAEMPGWDFDAVASDLKDAWERELGQIEIEGGKPEQLTCFYSALYRTAFLPRAFSDADGRYPAFNGGKEIKQMPPGQTFFTDFSLWDTYRAEHPLITLLHPHLSGEMMQSLVLMAEQGGWLPIFPCWNSYTAAMIGDHATAAIADAYIKGVRNFDVDSAYKYMRQNAFATPADSSDYRDGKGRRALDSYLHYGYIPLEDAVEDAYHKREQTSRTLEYAFDDFALAQMSRALGYDDDADTLTQRAQNYRNVINPLMLWADGRHSDGSFLTDSNPYDFATFITEGAPCHYTWYAPHDPEGLVKTLGGKQQVAARLDSLFTQRRYWHGNEPCHQIPYLFNFVDRSDLTEKWVHHILATEYLPTPGGLSGNDDAGQMSAWYVFSALGFYPMCPATNRYQTTRPLFPRAVIHLEDGRDLVIQQPEICE